MISSFTSRRLLSNLVVNQHAFASTAARSATSRLIPLLAGPVPHPISPQQSFSLTRPSPLSNFGNPPKRSIFIQTATTPNPESIKFVPNGRLVLGHGGGGHDDGDTSSSSNIDEQEDSEANNTSDTAGFYVTRKDNTLIARSPLAKSLFNLSDGIKSIYLGYDFITVTKYAEAHWQHLQTPIFGAIMDFYASGKPALLEVPEITDTTILEDDDEVVAMIKELLETRIRPAVQEDGGDIHYVGFEHETGIVTVKLAGSCVGCPSSSVTLKNGVENMLMHYIPEVTHVVSLEEEEEGEEDGEPVVEQNSNDKKKLQTYEERLAAAGIPYSD